MQARFAAGEAAGVAAQALLAALALAFKHRDLEAFAACLADDVVFHDRRAVSILGAADREQWIESIRTLWELAPDVEAEPLRILTWSRHGRVDLARRFGTREGGPFEDFFLRLYFTAGDHIQRVETFDIDAADAVLARFAELCAAGD
jgi:hypothetical protein